MISGKNYIGDKLSSNSSITFKTFNPLVNIENDILFFEASDSEIKKATKIASEAFRYFSVSK